MVLTIVREYRTAVEFEKGIDIQRGLGWALHEWKLAVGNVGCLIVAVYKVK